MQIFNNKDYLNINKSVIWEFYVRSKMADV